MSSPFSEKLPDSALDSTLELRVLQGAQAGASVPLFGESNTVGSDALCDVILSGANIAARHVCITTGHNGFSVQMLEGETIVAGSASNTPPWQFGTTLYVGDVAITVDRSAAAWTVAAPLPPPQNKQPAGNGIVHSRSVLRHWKRWAAASILLLIISVCALIWWRGAASTATGKRLSASDVVTIKTLIAQRYSNSSNAMLTLDMATQTPVVRGYLPTAKKINTLEKALSKWQDHLRIAVLADDTLASASRQFLIQERSHLKVTVTDGRAKLSGLEVRQDAVQRLAGDLQQAVSGLAAVDMTFVDRQRLEDWLRQWRESLPGTVHGPVQVHVDRDASGQLKLAGALAPEQIQNMLAALTQRSRQKNLLLAVATAVDVRPELSSATPLVRAFSAGPVPYVFLTNGQRVMIGGAVNGFNLVAIGHAGPVFQKQGA